MQNRTVILTGANNGLGLHLAVALVEEGHSVAGLDLSGENLALACHDHPGRLRFCRCDVTDDQQVEKAVQALAQEWGQIDALVNNACTIVYKRFDGRTIEQTRREFEVNYFGYVRMIAAVLPYMKAWRAGYICNVSSAVGWTGFPGISGYASTKGAIEALSRTLRLELARCGICVSLVHPPLMRTVSTAPLGVPARAMADPAEVARKLAKKLFSSKYMITPDLFTGTYVRVARWYPDLLARLYRRVAVSGV